jgi:hypothetical protein
MLLPFHREVSLLNGWRTREAACEATLFRHTSAESGLLTSDDAAMSSFPVADYGIREAFLSRDDTATMT